MLKQSADDLWQTTNIMHALDLGARDAKRLRPAGPYPLSPDLTRWEAGHVNPTQDHRV